MNIQLPLFDLSTRDDPHPLTLYFPLNESCGW